MEVLAFTCQVCGTSLPAAEVVSCPRCATPHHRDCWDYLGGCAVFACGGTAGGGFQLAAFPPTGLYGPLLDSLPFRQPTGTERVLAFSPHGDAIALAPDETAIEITPEVFHSLGFPTQLPQRTDIQMLLAVTGGVAVVLACLQSPGFFLACLPILAGTFGGLAQRADVARVWLVRTAGGELECQFARHAKGLSHPSPDTRHRLPRHPGPIIRRPCVPVAVRLNFHVRPPNPLAGIDAPYREFVLQMSTDEGDQIDLVSPFQSPREKEPRGEFLRRVAATRTLGRTVGRLLRVHYEEGLAKG